MANDRTRKIINHLFTLAQDVQPVSRARIVSAIVHRNKIIAYGFNQLKTHPMAARFSKHPEARFLHAEVAAIRNCINKHGSDVLKKSSLIVARAKQTNVGDKFYWGMAKPCSGCSNAISTFKIPTVIYTTNIENEIGVIFNDFD